MSKDFDQLLKKAREAADKIINEYKAVSTSEEMRYHVWDCIKEQICKDCGTIKKGKRCYCTWDD